jgi:hypothetical protein
LADLQSLAAPAAPSTVDPAQPLFATRAEVEQLANVLGQVLAVQAGLVRVVDRLAPAPRRRVRTPRPGPAGPALRALQGGRS